MVLKEHTTQNNIKTPVSNRVINTNKLTAQPFLPTSISDKITNFFAKPSSNQYSGIINLPAQGVPNDNCGDITMYKKCPICGRYFPCLHSCHRFECPTCYKAAAARAGKRISSNIRAAHAAIFAATSPEPAKDVYGRPLPNASLDDDFYRDHATTRINQILKYGGLRHMAISIPPEQRERWKNYSHKKRVRMFNKHLKTFAPNVLASAWIYHPARILKQILYQLRQYRNNHPERIANVLKRQGDKTKINPYNTKKLALRADEPEAATYGRFGFWEDVYDDILKIGSIDNYTYFSPHFHLLYFGTMPRADVYHQQTGGWVYKNLYEGKQIPWEIEQTEGKPLRDHVAKVATYLTSHAEIEKTETGRTHDIVHYTGLFSPKEAATVKDPEGKTAILKIFKSYIDCTVCGPGNHLELCNKETLEPIIGPNGPIYAQDKIIIPKKKLTPAGEKHLQTYLNSYNWAVSRIQIGGLEKTPAKTPQNNTLNTPDPPPDRGKNGGQTHVISEKKKHDYQKV